MVRHVLLLSALTLVPAPLAAQNEAALRRAFEGRLVAPRLDMPATKRGVNVYPHRQMPVQEGEISRDIDRYGVGIPAGQATRVSRIKVKGKHIELQLGRGGERQEPNSSSSYVSKSREEARLEDAIKKTTDKDTRKRLEDQLRDERDRRRRETERLNALARIERELTLSQRTPEEWALMAGARFNVRFDRDVPSEALTPDGLERLMTRWLDFEPPPTKGRSAGPSGSGGLHKGMMEADVELSVGPPLGCEESRAGGLDIRSCRWSLPSGHLEAQFVNGVLVKYSLSSESP